MKNIELYIRKKDWLAIILLGSIMAAFLSSFIYYIVDLDISHGIVFGLILGFSITILAMLFISLLNNHILPDMAKEYWLYFAMFFSFLSGFCGTNITISLAVMFDIILVQKILENFILFSIVLGFLTYFVGALLYSMVKMANIKEYNEKKLIQSRLKSLELQLNPHFLYNSLNSLSELIHQDINKSEKAILKLSSFLRSTMAERALINIDEELQNVQDYIELENIRFADSIILDISCEKKYKHLSIPKFSIQLLVENAIKHGYIKDNILAINIKIKKEENLEILVSNNGKKIEDKNFGIGLKNLQERLEILCSGQLKIIDKINPSFLIIIGEKDENFSS